MSIQIDHAYQGQLIFHTSGGAFYQEVGIGFTSDNDALFFTQTGVDDLFVAIGNRFHTSAVDGAIFDGIKLDLMTVHSYNDPTLADISSTASNFAGLEAGDALSNQVAALASIRTPLAGRSFRGRAYWGGYTEASASGADFNSTSQANLQSFYDDVQGDIATNTGGTMAVISRKLAVATPVSSVVVEGTFATQRRRLERVR